MNETTCKVVEKEWVKEIGVGGPNMVLLMVRDKEDCSGKSYVKIVSLPNGALYIEANR